MKHPLTSKERRGLVAVAAAALLCISSGFIFRNCSKASIPNDQPIAPHESVASQDSLIQTIPHSSKDSLVFKDSKAPKVSKVSKVSKDVKGSKDIKNNKSNKDSTLHRAKKNTKSKNNPPKVYPIRDPLSEPCD